jgi:hypothetical protein
MLGWGHALNEIKDNGFHLRNILSFFNNKLVIRNKISAINNGKAWEIRLEEYELRGVAPSIIINLQE